MHALTRTDARTHTHTRTRTRTHTHTHVHPHASVRACVELACIGKVRRKRARCEGHPTPTLRDVGPSSRPPVHSWWTGGHEAADAEGTQVDTPHRIGDRPSAQRWNTVPWFSILPWNLDTSGRWHRKSEMIAWLREIRTSERGARRPGGHGAQIPTRGTRFEWDVGGLD
jgi:hypothetical protein